MQNDLDELCDYFNQDKLSLNTSKSATIYLGSTHQNTLTIYNNLISQKTFSKYLGVFIDSKLTFRDHINHVVKPFIKNGGLLCRVRDIYPIRCLLSFYNAYARSVFCHGLLVYGSAAWTNLEKMEMAQRWIIRAIFFKRNFDGLQNILRETELNTVCELFILNVFREIFSQLRFNGTTKLSKHIVDSKNQKMPGSKKGLLLTPYNRWKSRSKLVEHTLIKGYN